MASLNCQIREQYQCDEGPCFDFHLRPPLSFHLRMDNKREPAFSPVPEKRYRY